MRMYFILTIVLLFSSTKDELFRVEKTDPERGVIRTLSDVNAKADALKTEILYSNSKTSIVVGTVYYVSNSGNDLNNGKSADKAWATLSKVSKTVFSAGDEVFFERGGLWRGSLTAKGGVRYSAYGKGEKPRIFGSPQNYSQKDKWIETGTPHLYVYDQVLEKDAGLLVFNNGEAHSFKKVIGIDGFSGSPEELKNDLEMYHNIINKKVYLYSTRGNPADRFSSIEFCLKDHIIKTQGDNILIDNLCIKYGGAHGIGSGSINGLSVTNCELGWIGGSLQYGSTSTTRYGNAIEIWGGCRDYYVDHCYIYQIYDAGITHQYKNPTSTETTIMENVTYSNNLIEYCTYSIEYFLNQPNSEKDVMRNILIKDNICRFAGYGWGWQRPNKRSMNIQGWRSRNPAKNFVITGNIFDRSKDVLIYTGAGETASLPKMKDNIYIQSRGGGFGFYGPNSEKQEFPFNVGIRKHLIEKGIDENPVVIFVD